MKLLGGLGPALGLVALLAGCASAGSPGALLPQAAVERSMRAPLGERSIVPSAAGRSFALCAPAADASHAACLGTVRAMSQSTAGVLPDSVDGLTPDDLSSLYGYPSPEHRASASGVIGIVVAYDDPNVEADLAVYRTHFGLPPCTTSNRCFTKISSPPAFAIGVPLGGSGDSTSVSANPTTNSPPAPQNPPPSKSGSIEEARSPDSVSANPSTTSDGASTNAAAPRNGGNTPNSVSANPTVNPNPPSKSGTSDAARSGTSVSASPGTVGDSPASPPAAAPASLAGWNAESDADVEAASAVCPDCKILLVEAPSDALGDLGNANLSAARHGATVINDSFGSPEAPLQIALQGSFAALNVPVFAAAGDNGPQVLFPAALSSVIAVAGTTIVPSGSTVTERLWANSGGGCSAIFPKASFDTSPCPLRSVADLAAVADPATGLAFYDRSLGGWGIIGGTSVAAPIVASMYALSGETRHGFGASQLHGKARYYVPVPGGGAIAGLGTPSGLEAF